ncbi:hypothetical protein [uncultured Desulfobacter sp.]|uniref:hypothetical protein n=1 Tax=uncultured Desulfobacter sp. TaxID=240139 RepID=UPI0029C7C3BC|nr:hypothetical protein [uncultured Desulfobacter sp.]
MGKFFLYCDLDRTLIPNGDHSESPQARPIFSQSACILEGLANFFSETRAWMATT